MKKAAFDALPDSE